MMYNHPAFAAALAEQRQRDLISEARTARLARTSRAARDAGDGSRPTRWFLRHRHHSIPVGRSRLARLRPARAR